MRWIPMMPARRKPGRRIARLAAFRSNYQTDQGGRLDCSDQAAHRHVLTLRCLAILRPPASVCWCLHICSRPSSWMLLSTRNGNFLSISHMLLAKRTGHHKDSSRIQPGECPAAADCAPELRRSYQNLAQFDGAQLVTQRILQVNGIFFRLDVYPECQRFLQQGPGRRRTAGGFTGRRRLMRRMATSVLFILSL